MIRVEYIYFYEVLYDEIKMLFVHVVLRRFLNFADASGPCILLSNRQLARWHSVPSFISTGFAYYHLVPSMGALVAEHSHSL